MAKPIHTTSADEEPEIARQERKRAKKLAKLARREAESQNSPSEATAESSVEAKDADMVAAKKARKAEKKRLKQLRKGLTGIEADQHGVAAISVQTSASESLNADSKLQLDGQSKQKKRSPKSQTIGNGASEDASLASYQESHALRSLPQSDIDSFLTNKLISIDDSYSSSPFRPIISFSHLPEDARTTVTASFRFAEPTPIQSASWPPALAGRDVIGIAETGSGKTLAFGLPCLRHVLAHRHSGRPDGPRAAIISPTRELAAQIHEQIDLLASKAGVKTACVYGGVPKDAQRAALQTASIVIATPGRLNDLISEGATTLSSVTYLVLDEADRMLDKGFEDAIRQIVGATASNSPSSLSSLPTRQTLMFTATWPPSVRDLAATFMQNPARINIGDSPSGELRANTRITQTVEVVDPRAKEQRLVQLLKQHQRGNGRVLVFALYKKEAARVEGTLRQRGFRVAGIHGDLSQDKRSAALERFKSGVATVLVATDVAARGLDIPDVKAVINVTFPLTVEDYVHRIGRTGRAGASGIAVTLFTEHDKPLAGALVNVLRAAKQEVPEDLLKFGTAVKRKQHDAYGAFYRDTEGAGKAVKIKFDD